MTSSVVEDRPSIEIRAHVSVAAADLRHVLLGIEEEGIPYCVVAMDELNPLVLAHAAATASRLGIGLGLSLGYAVLTLDKLPEHRPYLATYWGQTSSDDRIIGSNAARLVKRIPLRPFIEGNTTWKH